MNGLIVKTSSMGDILHTLPALTDAAKYYPNIQFDWVIEKDFFEIPYWCSFVRQVIPVSIRVWQKKWLAKPTRRQIAAFLTQLQKQKYDAIIDAQGLLKSALLITRLACGLSHGYNWQSIREPLASLFYDYRYYVNKQQHAVERIRELFAYSLHYKKPNIIGDYGIIQYFLPLNSQKKNNPYVLFFHASSYSKKDWPESHWRQLIAIIEAEKLTIKLPWWTHLERQRALRLSVGFKNVEILPRLSLGKLAQQIIRAKVIVSVDTGLSHLTAALNKSNITLYGPTNPELIGGYGKAQQAIISSNGEMSTIEPYKVYQQLLLKLKN